MDVVDTQVHLFLSMGIEGALAAMDSMEIQAALIDEYWGLAADRPVPMPGYHLDSDVFRPVAAGAVMASMRHPDRFAYLLRIDHRDPEIDSLMRQVRDSPYAKAVRFDARTPAAVSDLRDGKCRGLFEAASRYGVPVFALSPGNTLLFQPYIEEFSEIPIIIDHVGMPRDSANFEEILRLSAFKNAALKWCHAAKYFGASEFPFPEVVPFLKRALDTFGRERIMWASDFTAIQGGHRWGDTLYCLRGNPALTREDQEWILGKTARKLLQWAPPKEAAKPKLQPV